MASDFTVERNSKKYVLGADGYLKEYIADAAAIEFNADGSYKGVLVEPASTQLLGGGTDTPTTQTVTVTAEEHTLSFYGSGSVVLSGVESDTLTGTGTDAERVSLTFTPTAGSLTLTVSGSPKYWQLEKSPIATSYIPNTGAVGTSVTRVKDDIYLTSASSLIGQTEGTLFIEVDWQETSGADQFILVASDGTNNNKMQIYKTASPSELIMYARANGVDLTVQGEASTAYTGIQKIAFAYKTDDFELYRNGSSISSDTSGSLASLATMTDVDFGQSVGANIQANMWIRAVALFTTRLSDAECEALTTI